MPAREGGISLTGDGRLELSFLGVGAAFATTMDQSNLLVVKGASHVLIDLGSRASVALARAGRSALDVERLLVTHSHADHIGGVEEWCLKWRYLRPTLDGGAPGDHRPTLITTADHVDNLWDASLRGGLEHCEAGAARERLTLDDYADVRLAEPITGRGRPAYRITVGSGDDAIDLELVRTNHIPNGDRGWDAAFYAVGVLIDGRVLFSGDTLFDPELLEELGASAEVIFHDCQDVKGGVHASYEELLTLPPGLRAKMLLYHLADGTHARFDPLADGFAGWAVPFAEGKYVF